MSRIKDIERMVCDDILRRQQLGLAKYGVSVAENPLPLVMWLQHAYEEALDTAVYLRRAIEQLDYSAHCQPVWEEDDE